jgi:hypothetical protein
MGASLDVVLGYDMPWLGHPGRTVDHDGSLGSP